MNSNGSTNLSFFQELLIEPYDVGTVFSFFCEHINGSFHRDVFVSEAAFEDLNHQAVIIYC